MPAEDDDIFTLPPIISIDPRTLTKPLADEAWTEMLMWRDRWEPDARQLLWVAVQILDAVKVIRGVDEMDVVMAALSARYAGRRVES